MKKGKPVKKKRCKRIKKNGERCKRTRAPNSKFCISHGGSNFSSKKWRGKWLDRVRTGKTSKYILAGPKVSEIVEEIKKDERYLDIDENIAVMTAIVRGSIIAAEKKGGVEGVLKKGKDFIWFLEKLQKSLLTKAKIEESMKHKIDIEVVDVAMRQMIHIVKRHVRDPLTLRAIADDFANVRVHEMPIRGKMSRQEGLKQLEKLDGDVRDVTEVLVHSEILDKNSKKVKKRGKKT